MNCPEYTPSGVIKQDNHPQPAAKEEVVKRTASRAAQHDPLCVRRLPTKGGRTHTRILRYIYIYICNYPGGTGGKEMQRALRTTCQMYSFEERSLYQKVSAQSSDVHKFTT